MKEVQASFKGLLTNLGNNFEVLIIKHLFL